MEEEYLDCEDEIELDKEYEEENKYKLKRDIWQKRCKCGRNIKRTNKSGFCRDCFIKKWKKKNYNGRKPKDYCLYVAVSE